MDGQISMKALNFTNFLEQGALLRVSANQWFLLQGPFTQKSEIMEGEVALFHPDFFAEPNANYWIPETFYRLTDHDLEHLCADFHKSLLAPMSWQGADLQSFSSSFNSILKQIQAGTLNKAVPIVFEKSTEILGPQRLAAMIQALIKAPTNLYVFGFWQKGQGILGATPEVLLRQSGQHLTTMALAGTCPKSETATRSSLLEDPKERHEHDLVVQDILQSLRHYGHVQAHETQVMELPTLFHLKTDIDCELPVGQSFSFLKACQALHPTPALGVSPRSFDYQWMKTLPEQKGRGGFGAPWGLQWSREEALCLVAIRNIQWSAAGSRIGSGCGIVAQSDLQQEWRELSHKRQSVKKVLGLES
ncbi:chorismate-binding protein [Bdellovibrio sp. HCB337]|uniref:chorismate-binding protein n=1 Tax=Bdellovibrio sp. HCB337 TaxID=3394358 RepID=UPI0039A5B25C